MAASYRVWEGLALSLVLLFSATIVIAFDTGGNYICLCLLSLILLLCLVLRFPGMDKRVCVLVLGDIGRHPRMQYHALSFARHGYHVDMLGYGGSKPHDELLSCKNITLHEMPQIPVLPKYLMFHVFFLFVVIPRIFHYGFKIILQSFILAVYLMLGISKPKLVLLQNPPALPTIGVASLICFLRGSKLFIDWHNYGYTILSMAVGKKHPLVKISKWYEKLFGRFSHDNLCVTNAMKEDLAVNWSIKAVTMHDRPPLIFKQTSKSEQHKLFLRLSKDYAVFGASENKKYTTAFTRKTSNGGVESINERPALLISSTSWTEDEDFSILLSALEKYEAACCESSSGLPKIVCAITGKGPMKEYYQGIIATKKFQHVHICTPWLAAEDYPLLLGSADIGICLHTSSSGLDLPMKVVDMFGCGLPVCAT
uniref:Chitobiosyldiphosphodolichol beta-mannosyltransferase-like n=1 Tax=Saccoglossus kowalevskii TaxID=10224 RepID=A0ABM0M406_SACKO